LKKAAQKLLLCWSRDVQTPVAQMKKVFLLLFLQKKKCLLAAPHRLSFNVSTSKEE